MIQKDFPVPYKTNLLPWSILNFPVLKDLEIPISDPAFRSQKDLIYNPLSPENQLSLEEAIAIDFDFYHHPEYTLSLKAKQKLLKQLERIVSLCLNLENKEY